MGTILNIRIKEQRLKNNLTLLEVANRLGIKEATMQRYESGVIKNISHETILKLAQIFGCTPSYLMGWEDEKTEIPAGDDRDSEIVRMFSELTPDEQKSVLDYIAFVLSKRSDS